MQKLNAERSKVDRGGGGEKWNLRFFRAILVTRHAMK